MHSRPDERLRREPGARDDSARTEAPSLRASAANLRRLAGDLAQVPGELRAAPRRAARALPPARGARAGHLARSIGWLAAAVIASAGAALLLVFVR